MAGRSQREHQDREVGVVTLRRLRAIYRLAQSISVFSQLVQVHWPRWASRQHYLCEQKYQYIETGSPCKIDYFCGWMPKTRKEREKEMEDH